MSAPDVVAELQRLCEQGEGVLSPARVVEEARDPANPLHKHFVWEDSAAAHQYRLWQARVLINQVRVTITTVPDAPVIRAFCSMVSDRRGSDGGAYRQVEVVMADEPMRQELLTQALKELQGWQRRYRHLSELAAIFAAVDQLRLPECVAVGCDE